MFELNKIDQEFKSYSREELEAKMDIADMITLILVEEIVIDFYNIENTW